MSVSNTRAGDSLVSLPKNPVGYVAIVLAAVTGVIHLFLAPQVIGFSRTLGILFALNGLGFVGGVVVYVTRYWRRELFLVAAGYAVVTVLAFFAFQGFSVDAFYRQGSLNTMAVVSKGVEALFAIATAYLYTTTE